MNAAIRDLRFQFRQLVRAPGFAVTTILTLALGIGATAAVFSMVNAVLLRPLPFPEPERLISLLQSGPTLTGEGPGDSLSYPNFFDWRSRNKTLDGMASYRGGTYILTGWGEPQHLTGYVVSANFFRVLRVHPSVGRDFRKEEEKPGSRVVMLGEGLWKSTFSADPNVVGRAVTLNGLSYTVAGVVPAELAFPVQTPPPALWTTLADNAAGELPETEQRGNNSLRVVARLRPESSLDRARADLTVIARQIATQYPDTSKAYTEVVATPLLESITGNSRAPLRVLFGAVMAVLLIACVNVAGLLLARASRRRSEISVRAALGAGRGEIIRQMLAESVFLSLCGGALGTLLASWILAGLVRFLPRNAPRLDQISVDGTVLLFVLGVSLLTGLLFGILPALRISRLDPALALRDGGRTTTAGRGQGRLHDWLVIAETALGLMLLVASGLLVRSFVEVLRVDPGFDPRSVLTADLHLPDRAYSREQKIQFYDKLLPRLARLPGVQAAAASWPLPLAEGRITVSFQIEGRPVAPGDEPAEAVSVVTPGYFQTMRIPLLSGRVFDQRDDSKGPPAIMINERFARKYFPGENPVGKHIRSDLGDGLVRAPMREVIGVVGNVRHLSLTTAVDAQYYLPWQQAVITSPSLSIRTSGDPLALAGAVRAQVAELDRELPVFRVRTLESLVSRATAQPRFITLVLVAFAGMALILSAVGLYAVLSYMVARRTAEIGVRVALGAQRTDVLHLVLRRGLTLAGTGVIMGLAASVLLTRYLESLLFGVRPLDSLTFAIVTAILLAVSLVASGVPAWRAARLDPVRTLRQQ